MGDGKDIDMSLGQDPACGEMPDSLKSTIHENGVTVNKIETEVGPKAVEQVKAVVSSRKADRSKKPKELAPKEVARSKVTVPHPFSLATDKRMSQERRRSVDLSPLKEKLPLAAKVRRGSVDLTPKQTPKLSKSVSCVNKAQSTPDASKARSKLENGDLPAANSKVTKRSLTIHNKQSQIPVKQGGDATSAGKLGKSPTFKALPLPRFYNRNNPTMKPNPVSKTLRGAESPQGDKPKKRGVSHGAKETIKKLIKSTRRALNQSKETRLPSVVAAA
ncbi:hypothetical protein MLD38_036444 [Melastoma candidum]|uniref:Uncharacterized protein n=1 Tax=Melastoma candidum TaxID=119954 RepID=A0ACB9LJR4_9MYRT|nr:hypothetical protein MLD38_036444 [Melastoma candidum]